jgi:tetratricopeptide (TPR) repeat protein
VQSAQACLLAAPASGTPSSASTGEAYNHRGNVYLAKKDHNRAIADHDQAIRLKPDYAARDGTLADDGGSRHSPYAEALMLHLEEPGLDIRFLFDKVRDSVLAKTRNEQMPFTYGSLPAERFVFRHE